MNLYDLIFESIQTKYENGELTLEQANEVNDLAYEKYVVEFKEDIRLHNNARLARDKLSGSHDKNKIATRRAMDDYINIIGGTSVSNAAHDVTGKSRSAKEIKKSQNTLNKFNNATDDAYENPTLKNRERFSANCVKFIGDMNKQSRDAKREIRHNEKNIK